MRVKIADVRRAAGITQAELAQEIGLSRSYLALIENGQRPLTTKKQLAIAKALRVDPTELIDFNGPDYKDEERLIAAFRELSPDQRKKWLEWADIAIGVDPHESE